MKVLGFIDSGATVGAMPKSLLGQLQQRNTPYVMEVKQVDHTKVFIKGIGGQVPVYYTVVVNVTINCEIEMGEIFIDNPSYEKSQYFNICVINDDDFKAVYPGADMVLPTHPFGVAKPWTRYIYGNDNNYCRVGLCKSGRYRS